jgi:hypothetical protein
MGLFDRLFKGESAPADAKPAKAKKEAETFFLDADASSSMGNVDFMRRSNTIRRTFPGTADNPGTKEMVAEVASMEASLEKVSEGLPGSETPEVAINLSSGVPTPVKKTFAQPLTTGELDQRMKGTAVGVNVPGGPAVIKLEKEAKAAQQAEQPQISQLTTAKPGAIDPFKQMAKDLNS